MPDRRRGRYRNRDRKDQHEFWVMKNSTGIALPSNRLAGPIVMSRDRNDSDTDPDSEVDKE